MIRPIVVSLFLLCAVSASAATFTVTNTNAAGSGSLAQAILDANANPGFDTIAFAIGSGPAVIASGLLPAITDPVLIDGRTQPGFAGTPLITLDSNDAHNALIIGAGLATPTEIWSLVIRDTIFRGIDAASPIILRGSWIGAAGSEANAFRGVELHPAHGSIIGGTTPAERNVISGNEIGIHMSESNDVTVTGNYIGVDPSGAAALPNTFQGISVSGARIRIGGTTAGERNVISGSGGIGIFLSGSHHIVAGNYIGTSASGLVAIPNEEGIFVFSSDTVIGGTDAVARNVISGNRDIGVFATGNLGNRIDVLNNYIGVDATGEAALPNGYAGVFVDGVADIDIGLPGAGNVIAGTVPRTGGEGGWGIGVSGARMRIRGNYIGVSASGTVALPNASSGIDVNRVNFSSIGGLTPGHGNLILNNGGHGILIGDPIGFGPTENLNVAGNVIRANANDGIAVVNVRSQFHVFSRNSIDGNGGLAIDLGNDGVTPNDFSDADTGPNQLPNYPQFDLALATPSGVSVHGHLQSTPSSTFTLEFFSSPAGDPSGFGEGMTYIGSMTVTTNALGTAPFVFNSATVVPVGHVISGTATGVGQVVGVTTVGPAGTSEMARWILVEAQATASFSGAAFSIAENSGGTVTITITRANGNGAASVEYATASGTATSGADFPAQSGIINFADGQTSAQINIAITDDTVDEADETFTVTLSNPTGMTLGSPSTATITILDNEIAEAPTASEIGLLVMSIALAFAAMLVLRR